MVSTVYIPHGKVDILNWLWWLEICKSDFFLTFPADFWIPINFSNLNLNCSHILELRNLQEQVKKTFCYQKLFWIFTIWINCSSDLKNFASSRPSVSNFKSFSQSLKQFFFKVGQNNFGNNIPCLKVVLECWNRIFFMHYNQFLWNTYCAPLYWTRCKSPSFYLFFPEFLFDFC